MSRWPLLVLGALLAMPAAAEPEPAEELPGVGSEVPAFALPTYNPEASGAPRAGTMLLVGEDSDDPAARVIVVSFMASHCKPCRKELPFLEGLHKQYRAQGLRIIGVSIDDDADGIKAMGDILKAAKITFPVAKDTFGFTARRFLGTKVPLPSVFIADTQGQVLYVSRGYSDEISKTLVANIEKALAAKATVGEK